MVEIFNDCIRPARSRFDDLDIIATSAQEWSAGSNLTEHGNVVLCATESLFSMPMCEINSKAAGLDVALARRCTAWNAPEHALQAATQNHSGVIVRGSQHAITLRDHIRIVQFGQRLASSSACDLINR